jgi:hypothetical protein
MFPVKYELNVYIYYLEEFPYFKGLNKTLMSVASCSAELLLAEAQRHI